MQHIRLYFRKIYRVLLYTIGIIAVASAVSLSIARVFLPELKGYRPAIEQVLGQYLEHEVRISAIDARLVGLTPTVIFKDVHLLEAGGKKDLISFKEAQIGVALFSSLLQRRFIPSDFTVTGTVLSILQQQDGNYTVQGLDVTQVDKEKDADTKEAANQELAGWLFQRSDISVRDSEVVLRRQTGKPRLIRFKDVNVSMQNRENRHRLTGTFSLPKKFGKQVEFAMDVQGNLLVPAEWKGLFFVNTQGLHFTRFGIKHEFKHLQIEEGIADTSVWGQWEKGGIQRLQGDAAMYGVRLKNTASKKIHDVDVVKGLFAWSGEPDDWGLSIKDFQYITKGSVWPATTVLAKYKKEQDVHDVVLELSYFRIEDVRNLLLHTNLLAKDLNKNLIRLNPFGDANNVQLRASFKQDTIANYKLNGEIAAFGTQAWKNIPGVKGLSGRVVISKERGQLDMDSAYMMLDAPKLFRQPLVINTFKGHIGWEKLNGDWLVRSEDFAIGNADVKTKTDILLTIPTNKVPAFLDMQVGIDHINAARISKYLPVGIMKDNLVKWVDRSIKAGTVEKGSVSFYGRLKDFPFKRQQGAFRAHIDGRDFAIDYAPGWPGATNASLSASFGPKGMRLYANSARIKGNNIQELDLSIKDYASPLIALTGKANGKVIDGFRFMVNSPVAPKAKDFVRQNRFAGEYFAKAKLRIPLNDKVKKTRPLRYSGEVDLVNAQLHLLDNKVPITRVSGRVQFSEKGQSSKPLAAKIMQGDAHITVGGKTVDGKNVLQLSAQGKLPSEELYQRFALLGLQRVKGEMAWQGRFTLRHTQDGVEYPSQLSLQSSLDNVSVDLPPPFAKQASETRKMGMDVDFPEPEQTNMMVRYGSRYSAALTLDNTVKPARISRGELQFSDTTAVLPEAKEFRVKGVIDDLSHYEWKKIFTEHQAAQKKQPDRPILDIPVIFDLAYLNMPIDEEKKVAEPSNRKYFSPRLLPSMSGKIDRFIFADIDLGKLEWTSIKQSRGLSFPTVKLTAPLMKVEGSGVWTEQRDLHRTTMKAYLKTPDMGKMLSYLGYKAIIKEGKGQGHFDLRWKAPPYAFNFGQLTGSLSVAVEDGNISKVEPGAGRLLGLLSLSNLPRRLLLDFSDQSDGLTFDDMKGKFTIKNGNAVTKDFLIDSTLAAVLVEGRTGLAAQDFDQIITVTPKASGTLPGVGWLLGGPQAVPLVWLFERLFGSDLDKSFSRQYRVTGTWEQPLIERIDKENGDETSRREVQGKNALQNS